MNTSLKIALVALLTGSTLLPTTVQAAPKSSHHESKFRLSKSHHHHHHDHGYRTVKVWVKGHLVWHRGHKHWVPGHYEYRRIYF